MVTPLNEAETGVSFGEAAMRVDEIRFYHRRRPC
jgi:hypothetical protein